MAVWKCPNCNKMIEDVDACWNCGTNRDGTENENKQAFDKAEVEIKNGVVITDIQMKFTSMVIFMVKWAFASIPALLIISLIVGVPIVVVMDINF